MSTILPRSLCNHRIPHQLKCSFLASSSHVSLVPLSSASSSLHRSFTSSSSSSAGPSSASAPTHHQFSPRLPSALSQFSDCIVDQASGSWIFGTNGRKYLDFGCGIGVTNLGHAHPKVNAAAIEQISKGVHLQVNCVSSPPMIKYAAELETILPAHLKSDYQVLFSNSGAEAIENAVKLARTATGRQTVIVFQGGFHGRTIASGAMTTAKAVYRAGFQPTMAGVHVAPFPYCHRCPVSCSSNGQFSSSNCCNTPLDQLRLVLKQQTDPKEVAAIVVEPIQGEGGYIVPPRQFLADVRKLATEIGALLVADEVQTGFGRTGTMFASEQFPGFNPDILVIAKGIANGFPLSGCVASSSIFSKAPTGSIGGTYGGNAVSCAAASAVLKTFQEEKVLKNVAERGEQFRKALKEMSSRYPIADVRGLGLMNAVEFDAKQPYGTAGKVVKAACEENLLTLSAGVNEALRFIPPLNISEEEMAEGIRRLDRAMAKVFGKK